MANQNQNQGGTSNRGFASMDEDKQREIASKGGKAAHQSGNAHEFSSEEAREAARRAASPAAAAIADRAALPEGHALSGSAHGVCH